MLIDPVILRTGQAAAAILFGTAAVSKLLDMRRFGQAVASYGLLPTLLLTPAAWLLALAEAAVAMSLPFDAVRQPAALAGLGLLSLFFAAIAISLARGHRDIDCGCWAFGASGRDADARTGLSGWHLGRVALLGALLLPALFDASARAVVWVDYFTVLGTLAIAAGAFFAIDALLANQAAAQKLRS